MQTNSLVSNKKMPGNTLAAVLDAAAWCVITISVFFLLAQLWTMYSRLFSGAPVPSWSWLSVAQVIKSVAFALLLFGIAMLIKLAGRFIQAVEKIADKIGSIKLPTE